MSSESLETYSREYALVGTYHKILLDYVNIPNKDLKCGSVFRSFSNAIKVYLKFYNEKIVNELENIEKYTIISFYAHAKPIINQIK